MAVHGEYSLILILLKRLLIFPLTLWALCTLTFFLVRMTPGGPFSQDRQLDASIAQAMQEKYHLNAPVLKQYTWYITDLLKGDLGPSYTNKAYSVNEIIANHLPCSLWIGIIAMMMAILIGVSLGM